MCYDTALSDLEARNVGVRIPPPMKHPLVLISPIKIYGVSVAGLSLEDEFSRTKMPTPHHLSEPQAASQISPEGICAWNC